MFILLVLLLSTSAAAGRVTLTDVTDSNTNQLFSQLPDYRLASQGTQGILASANAANALLGLMSSQIKQLPDYTGVFTARCTILFNDFVEQASCDITPATPHTLTQTTELQAGSQLSTSYTSQIRHSHILFANVFADWTHKRKSQDFLTNLYFRETPCSGTLSASLEPTETVSNSPERSLSTTHSSPETDSKTNVRTATKTPDDSKSGTHTAIHTPDRTASNSPSAESSWSRTFSNTLSAAISHTHSLVASLSYSDIKTRSFSESDTDTATDTDIRTSTRTASISPVPSLSSSESIDKSESISLSASTSPTVQTTLSSSSSDDHSASPSRTRQVFTGSEWALWSFTTGVYQDATNQTSRYSTNNGVVTDSYTGLQWEAAGSAASTYTWSSSSAPGSAQAYCAGQNTGGFNDWRLPTRIELQTTIDYTLLNPSINTTSFTTTTGNYWSATPYAPTPTSSWYSYFSTGGVSYIGNTGTYYVRCIRLGSAVPTPRYTDETGAALTGGSTQVKDVATGLIWQRGVGGSNTHAGAVNDCSILTLGGQTWRLPKVRELSTLVDVSKASAPTIDGTAFTGTSIGCYWTNTSYQPDVTNSWAVYFDLGNVVQNTNANTCFVRCVR